MADIKLEDLKQLIEESGISKRAAKKLLETASNRKAKGHGSRRQNTSPLTGI